MKTRKKICTEIFKRYQEAGKKDKAIILDEYAPTLNYNRDYLAYPLTNWGKTRYSVTDGKPVKYIAKPPVKGIHKTPKGRKTGRPEKHHKAFVKVLSGIWELFDFQCGKLVAPLVRGMIDFLVKEFMLSEEFRALLLVISPATIDRKLRKEKARYRLKGIHTTKPGSLLKSQIPIRVCFDRNEKRPGFFELDTVSHCGARASGQFCQTLTVTDVLSGWTEECALLNNAHRWVKEQIAQTRENLPFPMLGIDSDFSPPTTAASSLIISFLTGVSRTTLSLLEAVPTVKMAIASLNRKMAMWYGKLSVMPVSRGKTLLLPSPKYTAFRTRF